MKNAMLKLLWMCGLPALSLLLAVQPALAVNDPDATMPVNITITKTLSLKFTGNNQISAVVRSKDLQAKLLILKNNGMIHWNANLPWKITMVRTRWLKTDGNDKNNWNNSTNDITTYVKKTSPPPASYVEITKSQSVWFTGLPGKDHTDQVEIKLDPLITPPVTPGTYQMTVAFTIAEN
jgi:hypothetical protein